MSTPTSMAPTITAVVATVDDRPASERAVPLAAALARRSGTTLELLSVDPVGLSASRTQRRLDDVARLVPAEVAVTTTVEHSTESVGAVLGQLVRPPGSVLCIATHGRGAALSLALGSVSAHLVRRSRLPVLVVGPACPPEAAERLEAPAVVAIDGGHLDDDVIETAALWSRSTGAPLVVTTTITRPSEPVAWTEADQLLRWGEDRLARMGCVVTSSVIAAADVDEGILRAIDGPPGCIVLGSHRRGPLGRVVLGSTVTRVAHSATCPVLVAPPPHATDDDDDRAATGAEGAT